MREVRRACRFRSSCCCCVSSCSRPCFSCSGDVVVVIVIEGDGEGEEGGCCWRRSSVFSRSQRAEKMWSLMVRYCILAMACVTLPHKRERWPKAPVCSADERSDGQWLGSWLSARVRELLIWVPRSAILWIWWAGIRDEVGREKGNVDVVVVVEDDDDEAVVVGVAAAVVVGVILVSPAALIPSMSP